MPFIILTLGLLMLVINALMLLLTSWLSGQIGLGFHVEGFGTALVGALVVTVATWSWSCCCPANGPDVARRGTIAQRAEALLGAAVVATRPSPGVTSASRPGCGCPPVPPPS